MIVMLTWTLKYKTNELNILIHIKPNMAVENCLFSEMLFCTLTKRGDIFRRNLTKFALSFENTFKMSASLNSNKINLALHSNLPHCCTLLINVVYVC